MVTSPDRLPRTPTRTRRAMGGIGQSFVPYTGAIKDVDLGTFALTTTGAITGEQITSTDDITMQGHLLTLGDGTATDIVISFSASANDGTITYDESDNEFDFGSSLMTTTGAVAAGDLTVINYSENLFRGLLLHMPGDGNANNISGNNGDGTLNNGTYGNGIFGQSFDLDGTGDYISMSDTTSFKDIGTGDFTVMGWAYLDEDVGGESDYLFDCGTERWTLGVLSSDDEMDMFISGSWRDCFNAAFPIGQWVHVAVTRDSSGNLKGYYDGVLQNTVGSITQSVSFTGAATIGSKYNGVDSFWKGSVDEFMIFNRAFEVEEVMAAFKLGRPDGYFDQIMVGTMTLSGNSITDSTGTISFGNENLTSTGILTMNVQDVFETPFRDALIYLTGDGTANDSSGYGADATLASGSYRNGVFGQAFEFDGAADYVALDLTNVAGITTGAFTMMGWAYLDLDVGGSPNYLFDTNGRWILGVLADDDMDMFIDGSWRQPFGSNDFSIGRWVHFAVTRDGSGNLKGYYDGVLKATVASITNSVGFMTTTAALGAKHDGSSSWWNGACDEFQIFDRTLDAEEVQAAHKLGRPDVLAEEMDISGDVVFRGDGSGLVFGHMYTNSTVATTLTDQSTWYELDGATAWTTGQLHNCTFSDPAITVLKAGIYEITWSLSTDFSATPGSKQQLGYGIMVGGAIQAEGQATRTLSNSTDTGNACGVAILDLAVNAAISLAAKNETSAGKILHVEHGNMTVKQLGGT